MLAQPRRLLLRRLHHLAARLHLQLQRLHLLRQLLLLRIASRLLPSTARRRGCRRGRRRGCRRGHQNSRRHTLRRSYGTLRCGRLGGGCLQLGFVALQLLHLPAQRRDLVHQRFHPRSCRFHRRSKGISAQTTGRQRRRGGGVSANQVLQSVQTLQNRSSLLSVYAKTLGGFVFLRRLLFGNRPVV